MTGALELVDPMAEEIANQNAAIGSPSSAIRNADACVMETVGVDQIFAPLKPRPYLCPGLSLAPGRPTFLGGYGFVGKTLTGISIVLSAISGRSVFGVFSCAKQCIATHVDYEVGFDGIARSYQRQAAGMGISVSELKDSGGRDRLRLASFPSRYLDDADIVDVWCHLTDGVDVCFVDSNAAGTRHVDENSKEAGRSFYAMAEASAKTGCTFIVAGHSRKPTESAKGGRKMAIRGSGAIYAGLDNCFMLEAERGEPIEVHHEKNAVSGILLDPFYLRIEDVPVNGDPRGGLIVRHLDAAQVQREKFPRTDRHRELMTQALGIIVKEPGIAGVNAVCARMGGKKQVASMAVNELLDSGAVVNKGSKARPEFYAVRGAL